MQNLSNREITFDTIENRSKELWLKQSFNPKF